MFTGIIEETGKLTALDRQGAFWKARIRAEKVLAGTKVGDSIAVDGVCLTVIEILKETFAVEISGETRERAGVVGWATGTQVNLERALLASGRLGGHFVQGHVDTRGSIISLTKTENGLTLSVRFPHPWRKYLAAKGAVAVDGISLTVADLGSDEFSVALIPHTLEHTTLIRKKTGDAVNLEFDIIAKYTESLLAATTGDEAVLSADFFRERGFIK
jgi:riboflavin synthase